MKSNFIRIILVFATAIILSNQLMAQFTCPPVDPNCPWGTLTPYAVERTPYVFDLSIDVQTRDCGGELDVLPDWGSMDGLRYYYMSDEALREVFMNEFVYDIDMSTVPICGSGTKKVNFYYKSECKVRTRCTYKIDPAEMNCDDCYPGPVDYYEKNGEYFIDVFKWVTCGEKCCKETFEVCKTWDVVYSRYNLNITSRNKYEVTPCSPSECTDWDTDAPLPCISNCEH